jgi:hypothetical protein
MKYRNLVMNRKGRKQPNVRTVRARKCKFRVNLAIALWKRWKRETWPKKYILVVSGSGA